VLSALAFNIIPTIFEVGLVTGVLVCACRSIAVAMFSLSIVLGSNLVLLISSDVTVKHCFL